MALEIRGKFIKALSEQKGASKNGEWRKQDFVVETIDAYPKKICFTVWNDKISQLEGIQYGEEVRVMFSLSSREYNEKWYTDVAAYSIETLGKGKEEAGPSLPNNNVNFSEDQTLIESNDEEDLPF